MNHDLRIHTTYDLAKARYSELGVDVERAMHQLATVPISLHCWQGDDVNGFESADTALTGGIQTTGNYPGKARNADELRADLEVALAAIPGSHRLNLHAIYAETNGRRVERNHLEPIHFARWVDWANERGCGMDFNPTFFSHPLSDEGFTLSHHDKHVRTFWIEHAAACRRIGAYMGQKLCSPTVVNIWIPDGYKDSPVDRLAPRERLCESLDAIFAESFDPAQMLDAVESKLFGLGSESYVTGSHEFYLGYAIKHNILLCLDSGHFHPTETISDKISAVLLFVRELLLHVSRGVRWDSDHVVTLTDELQAIASELVRCHALARTHIGLDYFDASINRVAAWVIGARNMLKALLNAFLEPHDVLRHYEVEGNLTQRLAVLEELKSMPSSAVWDEYCLRQGVPTGASWLEAITTYERTTLSHRV